MTSKALSRPLKTRKPGGFARHLLRISRLAGWAGLSAGSLGRPPVSCKRAGLGVSACCGIRESDGLGRHRRRACRAGRRGIGPCGTERAIRCLRGSRDDPEGPPADQSLLRVGASRRTGAGRQGFGPICGHAKGPRPERAGAREYDRQSRGRTLRGPDRPSHPLSQPQERQEPSIHVPICLRAARMTAPHTHVVDVGGCKSSRSGSPTRCSSSLWRPCAEEAGFQAKRFGAGKSLHNIASAKLSHGTRPMRPMYGTPPSIEVVP
jgi:hypothetical protein